LINSDLIGNLNFVDQLEELCVLIEVDKIYRLFNYFCGKKFPSLKRLHITLDSADGMTRVPVMVEQALVGGFLSLADNFFISLGVTASPIMECVVMQLPWLFPAKFGIGNSNCTISAQPSLDQLRPYGTLISDPQFQPPKRGDGAKRVGLTSAIETLKAFYER
jgi:hypothetical protein